MIQTLRSMKLLQVSRIFFPPLLVAFPELLAPKLLKWCNVVLPERSTLALPCLAQLFCNGELPTSGCCRNVMLRDLHPAISRSDKRGCQCAWCPTIPAGSEEDGSKVGDQLAHETFALPKIVIQASSGSSLRINHQQGVFHFRLLTGRWL